jgi:hypothetical protein
MRKTVGILVFNAVEARSFAGTFEVFSLTRVDGERAPGVWYRYLNRDRSLFRQ